MLEASACPAKDVQEEISLERKKTPEAAVFLDQLFELARRWLAVPAPELADIDQQVLAAVDLEFMD